MPEQKDSTFTQRHEAMLSWVKHEFKWPLVFAIPVVCIVVQVLSQMNFLQWGDSSIHLKRYLEIIHPALLAGFTLVAFAHWLKHHIYASLWISILGAAFFIREIHFPWSDYIMAAIILGLFFQAYKNPDTLAALTKNPIALSLMAMGFISYFSSEILLDRGLIKQPFQIYYGSEEWKLPNSSNMEESTETLGGIFLFLSVVVYSRSTKNPS
jgi:hypothetical protein